MITLETVPPELLGWALLSLVCSPLLIPFVMPRARTLPAKHRARLLARARRRGEVRSVVTTTDPLALLGFVDRSGPAPYDVEQAVDLGPGAERHLSDQEIEAVAEGLNARPFAEQIDDIRGRVRLQGLQRGDAIDAIVALGGLTRAGAAELLDNDRSASERYLAARSMTPNADDVERWLAELTRRNHP